ncbi:hypothetical protein [Pseudomonas sp. HLMP]|uniref:hypothetical protein n=1 Tax=Pseudomonas sp. HLMP TaxID=3153767 RepID=UPI00396771C2
MATSLSVQPYLHIDGFDDLPKDFFDKRKVRAGMRKSGRLVAARAQLAIALSRGASDYPVNRTGELVHSIRVKLSRSGFLVRIAPQKTSGMKEYYPAYLNYGVKRGARVRGLGPGKRRRRGARAKLIALRASGGWRITPRANYMADALEDSRADVQRILKAAFARALGG